MRLIFVIGLMIFILIPSVGGQENAADGWAEKGISLEENDSYSDAMVYFEKALSLDPLCSRAWYGKGICLQYQENPDHAGAIKCFENAIKINSSYIEAYMDMSYSLAVMGMYDEALQSADKAIESKPDYSDGMNIKGVIYYFMHDYNRAIEWFEKAIKADPNNSEPWMNIGFVYSDQDPNDPRAANAFAKAKELKK